MLKKILLLSTIPLILITIFSCEDNPVEPDAEPGRRDYVWQADTIKAPFFYISRMWGSSPEDVWAVGPGGSLSTTIWHYDGKNWKTDNISRSIVPRCIWGIDKNNVWIGGEENKIWHFDGNNWSEIKKFNVTNGSGITFSDIWGTSASNIYAVGSSGWGDTRIATVAHYNGKEWNLMEFPEYRFQFVKIRQNKKSNKYFYLLGIREDAQSLFEFDGKILSQILINGIGQNDLIDVEEIKDDLCFAFDGNVQTLNKEKFVSLFQYDLLKFGGGIYGRNKNDIFIAMRDGVTHYNGWNIENVLRLNNETLRSSIIFKNAIFFITNNFSINSNIIYKGTLK